MTSEEAKPGAVPNSATTSVRSRELTVVEQQRVKAMQQLANAPDRVTYLALQQEIAEQLNMSVRNVQHLLKAWQTVGVAGVVRQGRSDCGKRRLAEDWTNYIVATYRAGNRGGRRMSRAQVAVRVAARALEIGDSHPPSRASVYRVLQSEIDRQEVRSRSRSIGWSGETLILNTREGLEVEVKESNQVWQCDHTRVDLMVVDQVGEVLERPWLTTIVDTHSPCIMGIHLGMEAPSTVVVCLALRHAILPKQYSSAYELTQLWSTYGVPQYLYTDGGKEFNSNHLEQVANELKIVLCQRRYPAEGGIVERPFGTLNSELFATLPGYTGNSPKRRPKQAQTNARVHAIGLETESLSFAEAQAISRRVRSAGKLVTNQSVLAEVQDRDRSINQIHKQKPKKQKQTVPEPQLDEVQSEPRQNLPPCDPAMAELVLDATERSEPEEIEVAEVRVWDYEELKRNYGKWW